MKEAVGQSEVPRDAARLLKLEMRGLSIHLSCEIRGKQLAKEVTKRL